MRETNPNDNFIENEIHWFSEVLNRVFHQYFNNDEAAEGFVVNTPPVCCGDSSYARVIDNYGLSLRERLVLMLALMPHLRPNLLDVFFTKNAHFDRSFTEFGGYTGKSHLGFLPTGETVAFLLCNGLQCARMDVVNLFRKDHAFAEYDLVRLEQAEPHEPWLSGRLVVGDEFLTRVVAGTGFVPVAGEAFPARRITTELMWEDLVLPTTVRKEIDQIRSWIECHGQLMQCAVFRKHVKPGFRSLFYGPPGTGKTLTACLLGKATGLDVYRVDLSLVVSKYIGETEKNLSKIFDSAEKRNWILFFDEADSLFGKRTQTNSSNDKYANQEVSYLLQRMEDFPGIIILASNLKSNIDEAFSRRFQSVVYFPMPDADQRLALWNQFFSGTLKAEPSCNLADIAQKYELSGGSAINVLRYGAIQAAEKKLPYILKDDIMQGIRREFQKYGRTIQ